MTKTRSKRKVILCSCNDWANVGYTLSESLKTVGYEAKMLKLFPHSYNYEKQGSVVDIRKMIEEISSASIVQFMHSAGPILDTRKSSTTQAHLTPGPLINIFHQLGILNGKKIVMFHGGTEYRQNSNYVNSIANKIVDASIIQTYDLLGLGAKNENWVLAPIELNPEPDFNIIKGNSKLVFAHYPSNPEVKNSTLINNIINTKILPTNSRVEYNYSPQRISHSHNLQRVALCDIYIDHQGYSQKGKKYGEFGVATLEAAAMGKIVITCTESKERYEREYGKFIPFISNNKNDFEATIKSLLQMPLKEIISLKKSTYEWAKKNHSYEAIGERLHQIYEKI